MSIFSIPAGLTADKTGAGGLYGLMANVNNYSIAKSAVTTAGTNTTLTAAQLLNGLVVLAAGASGGFTITLPSTAAIIGGLGPTIPTDGTYAEEIRIKNDGVGQIGTVTAGDASTTLTGTMTIATNTTRSFLLTVLSATTIAIENIGSMAL